MILRRTLMVFGAAATLFVAGCGDKAAKGPAKDTVNFSILSTESAQNMESYWAPVLADMEKQTGLKVKPFFSGSYSALIEAMRFKQTDVGWFSNQSGLEAVRRSNGEVFARTFDPSGVDGYKSVIIVPADSKIRTLDDLFKCDRTLDFGMGDKKSTSGTLVPMVEVFLPRGVKPQTCFKTVLSANHQSNLFAVANKRLDAATNNSTAIRLNRDRKEGQAEQVRVIWESPTLPEDPMVWRKDLDPEVKEKLRQFFLAYGQGDSPEAAVQRANLAKISIGGFKPADGAHLLPVREWEAAESLALAEAAGDSARITEARESLAAIKAERAIAAAKAGAPAAVN